MVKAGYKQTEIGKIPEDWAPSKLGDVAEVIMGQSPKGTSYNKDGLGTALINGPTEFTEKYPIKVQWTTEPIRFCKINDLLLCVRGSSTGRMNIANDEYCIGRGVAAIRANTKANTKYLTYQVHLAIQKLLALSAGSTFPSVDGKAIKSIPIPCPEVKEQQAIAEVLSDVDALIAALDKLIAKKRDIKTGTMQRLLTGEKRLPGFGNGQGYKQTELGILPPDWELVELHRLIDKDRGIRYGIVQPGKFDPQGRLMIRGQDYSKGWVQSEKMFRVGDEIEKRYKNARVIPGDLIITIVGASTGHIEAIPDWLDGANLTQTTARISIDTTLAHNLYCKYVLGSRIGKNQVADYIKGGAQPGLNCGDVENFLVPLPSSIDEQTAIAKIFSDMDAEITALEIRRAKTQAIKQGMMQELLTGRTRLNYD